MWGFGIISLAFVLEGCAGTGCHKISPQDCPPVEWLANPRTVQLEIVVRVEVEDVLAGEALAAENVRIGIPPQTPPHLLFWSSDLRDHMGQRGVRLVSCEPAPSLVWDDPENQNRILHWDFSASPAKGASFTIRRLYELTLNECAPPLDELASGAQYDPSDEQVKFYTKSEPFLEQTDEIRAAAREAVGVAADEDFAAVPALERARRVFHWVRAHIKYQYPPPGGRGATVALREGAGDCGQSADLFVALCRAAGIPARFAGGFSLVNAKEPQGGEAGQQQPAMPTIGSHAWAEIMLPDGRWLPVDPTGDEENHFGRLRANTYITASAGRNIPLPAAPEWARYSFSDVENGRTEFMQTLTEVVTGAKIKESIERRVLSDSRAASNPPQPNQPQTANP